MVSNTYTSGDSGDTYNSGLRLRGYRGGNNFDDEVPDVYILKVRRNNNHNIEIIDYTSEPLNGNFIGKHVEKLPRSLLKAIKENFTDGIDSMPVFVRDNNFQIFTPDTTIHGGITTEELRDLKDVVSVFPSYSLSRITVGGGFFDFLFSKKVQPEVAPSPALESKPAGKSKKSKKSKKSIKKQKITKRNKK